MSAVRAAFLEFIGLFIDDGALAILLVVLIGVACTLKAFAMATNAVLGALLVGGAIAALVASVLRAASRS